MMYLRRAAIRSNFNIEFTKSALLLVSYLTSSQVVVRGIPLLSSCCLNLRFANSSVSSWMRCLKSSSCGINSSCVSDNLPVCQLCHSRVRSVGLGGNRTLYLLTSFLLRLNNISELD